MSQYSDEQIWQLIYEALIENIDAEKNIQLEDLKKPIVVGEEGFGLDSLDGVLLGGSLFRKFDNNVELECDEVSSEMTGTDIFKLVKEKLIAAGPALAS